MIIYNPEIKGIWLENENLSVMVKNK